MNDFLTWVRAEWERVAGFGLVVTGLVLLLVGWAGASGSTRSVDQISFLISGGLGGLFGLGAGATLILSADLHDEWRKLDEIAEAITALGGVPVEDRAVKLNLTDGPSAGGRSVSAPGPGAPVEADSGVAAGLVRAVEYRMLALGAAALGLVAAGWTNVSGQRRGADLSSSGVYLAVAGLLLLAVASVGFTASCRRRCVSRRAVVLGVFPPAPAVEPVAREVPADLLVAPGLPLVHVAGCPVLRGLEARAATGAEIGADLRRCGICSAP